MKDRELQEKAIGIKKLLENSGFSIQLQKHLMLAQAKKSFKRGFITGTILMGIVAYFVLKAKLGGI